MRNWKLVFVSAIVWLGTFASAQTHLSQASDVFSGWQQSLNDAADRALAAAVADRPWMKMDTTMSTAATKPPSPTTSTARLRAGIARVQQLRPVVEPILREQGLPTELSAVMLVESGGWLTISSPKGARGSWQIMPETARRYGLTVGSDRDDRTELVASTRAAARYLRYLHQQFGDWQLALAAYNAGEQRVQRALARSRTRTFSGISAALPLETRNYVPAVADAMAALSGGAMHDLRRDKDQNSTGLVYATTSQIQMNSSSTYK